MIVCQDVIQIQNNDVASLHIQTKASKFNRACQQLCSYIAIVYSLAVIKRFQKWHWQKKKRNINAEKETNPLISRKQRGENWKYKNNNNNNNSCDIVKALVNEITEIAIQIIQFTCIVSGHKGCNVFNKNKKLLSSIHLHFILLSKQKFDGKLGNK